MWLSTTVVSYRLQANVSFTMSYVADWRSNVSSKTQRHNVGEDRGVQLWPEVGPGKRGAQMTRVVNDARDWTHSVFVYVHLLRVRRQVGRIGVL